MSLVLFGSVLSYFLGIAMGVMAAFLILLILVQRGRGGGLTGALGGMGGQSAFGTKAGDVFTRVTMIAASIWIILCIATYAALNTSRVTKFGPVGGNPKTSPPVIKSLKDDDEKLPSTKAADGSTSTVGEKVKDGENLDVSGAEAGQTSPAAAPATTNSSPPAATGGTEPPGTTSSPPTAIRANDTTPPRTESATDEPKK